MNRLNETVPWEEFRPILEQVRQKDRKSNVGRKPFDVVLMFKLLIRQKLYNLSDEQLEYQVNDRISFMEFLGVGLTDAVPDATTVWLFRQQCLSQSSTGERIGGYDSQIMFEKDRVKRENAGFSPLSW